MGGWELGGGEVNWVGRYWRGGPNGEVGWTARRPWVDGEHPPREPGRRPRRPAPPRRPCRLPRASLHRQKAKGHQGGAPMAHRSAFRPAGVRPTRGSCYQRLASLPTSLPTTEVGDHDQDRDSGSRHFTSPPSSRFGTLRSVRNGLLRVVRVLPASLATTEEGQAHQDRDRDCVHHSPRLSRVHFGCSHPRAVHARSLEHPPCHLQWELQRRL